jgi:hypothetical protein
MRHRQQGLGLIGLLFFGVIFVFFVYVATQALPYVSEAFAVQRAANMAVKDSTSAAQVIAAFDRQAVIDDIRTIRGSDLELRRVGDNWQAAWDYEARIGLIDPVSLVIRFQGTSR